MQGGAVAGKASSCSPSLFAAEASRAGTKGCAQGAQDVPPSHLLRSMRQPVDLFGFSSCVANLGQGGMDGRGLGCSTFDATGQR